MCISSFEFSAIFWIINLNYLGGIMLSKLFTVVLLLVFMLTSVFAGTKSTIFEKAPKITEPLTFSNGEASQKILGVKVGTAVLAGKMWNGYSPQGSYTNLIYWDPYSGALGIVHRSSLQGLGSGRLHYAASDDGGANWLDQIGPFNFSGITSGRHPNMVITNPTKDTDPYNSLALLCWNTLTPGNWQTIQATTGKFLESSKTDSASWLNTAGHFVEAMAVNDQNGTVYVPIEAEDLLVFRTTDLGATWDTCAVAPGSWFAGLNGPMVEFAPDGMTGYLGWDANPADNSGYKFGFIKTTDGGNTWDDAPTWIVPSQVVGLPATASDLNYEVDLIVDANGNPHFAGVFVDTVVTSNTAVYHIFWNGSAFEADKIQQVNTTSFSLPGGLTALNEVELTRNLSGTAIGIKFIDATAPQDTTPDVFITYKNISSGSWSTVENVTQTPAVKEKFSNLAPRMGDRMHIYYTIFGSNDTDDLGESELWYIQDVNVTAIEDKVTAKPINFNLAQNYPNPFNPVTTIEYAIAQKGKVEVKVYNLLGKEVATLVNGVKETGNYSVTFDASKIASGVYFYTLKSDNLTMTRKMLVVK